MTRISFLAWTLLTIGFTDGVFGQTPRSYDHKAQSQKSLQMRTRSSLIGGGIRPSEPPECNKVDRFWTSTYQSHLAPGSNSVSASAYRSGHIYVTGTSNGDYFTAKYDTAGTELWIERYSYSANSDDQPVAVAVDAAENVYVTGYSTGAGTGRDYATVKYNASGIQQWVVRYNGTGNNDDAARAIALDDSGNVYVTGESYNPDLNHDYATVKYNPAGLQIWVERYNGPANSIDRATAIAVDDSGNVCVTGESLAPVTHLDFATVKYDRSGNLLWTARHSGNEINMVDVATAIATDDSGNVYITGETDDLSTNSDYTTIKYTPLGTEVWLSRYVGSGKESPKAISVDKLHNVYVTGSSYRFPGSDCATVKYNVSGVEQWVARFDGTSDAVATALSVDSSGNVRIAGYNGSAFFDSKFLTVQYNASGAELWSRLYSDLPTGRDKAASMCADEAGNVYVAGTSTGVMGSTDFATLKYDAAGTQKWIERRNGLGNYVDEATDIAVDDFGNIYVTGQSYALGSFKDYATVKYDPFGVEQWRARYNGPGDSDDCPVDVAVDAAGNVFVTGKSFGSGTSMDYATVKYNSQGIQQWVARYNGTANGDDEAVSFALDDYGNVYVTGYSLTGPSYDFATVKYNSDGVEQWVAGYDGPAGFDDHAVSLSLDGNGNVYVTGNSYGAGPALYAGYATVKYNSTGVEQWVARYDPPNNGAYPVAVAASNAGSVYVTGYSDGYVTIRYDQSGSERWIDKYEGSEYNGWFAQDLVVDALENVYVAGYGPVPGSYDFAVVKYDSSGLRKWDALYNGEGNTEDYANFLAVDGQGNVYMTGESYTGGPEHDYSTICYNSSGIQQWSERYNGPGNSNDIATGIAVDRMGNVCVTGYSQSGVQRQYVTIKYAQSATRVPFYSGWNLVSLSRNVPNPSRSQIFPSAVSRLFGYTDGYVLKDSMKPGEGYWLKLPAQECIGVPGDTIAVDTVEIGVGWNLIGSITSPIAVTNIHSDPGGIVTSQVYGYNGIYQTSNLIEPGRGYWIRANQPGRLILSSSPSSSPTTRIKIVPTTELPPSPPDGETETSESNPPEKYSLSQNFPNPFNPSTVISYTLPQLSYVTLKVYNILGQVLATLVAEEQTAGEKSVRWDAAHLPTGVYYYRLATGTFVETRKLLLLK